MSETSSEVSKPPQAAEKNKPEVAQAQKTGAVEQEKSFFQEVKEKANIIWNRFKEATRVLLGKADERLVMPQTEKATEIAEKTKTGSVRDFFKTQSENFRDGIKIRGNDIAAGWYDFLALTNKGREMFWNKFSWGGAWSGENRAKAKERKDYAKQIRAKNVEIKEKARKKRGEAEGLKNAAANIKEKTAAV